MALKINSLKTLHDYISGVAERADHHAEAVLAVSNALIGYVVTYADNIEVMVRDGNMCNVLWMDICGRKYAFTYDHNKMKIILRSRSIQGRVITELDNNTTLNQIQRLFNELSAE